MQKTQIIKLNTLKDDFTGILTKMKNKIEAKNSNNEGTEEDYDITVIVKHNKKSTPNGKLNKSKRLSKQKMEQFVEKQNIQNKIEKNDKRSTEKSKLSSFKTQSKPVQTSRSLFSTNNIEQNNVKINKNRSNPKIYDQEMHLQTNILPANPSFNQSAANENLKSKTSLQKINQQSVPQPLENNKKVQNSKRKIRESNKMPSIGQLFQFRRKNDQINQKSLQPKKVGYGSNVGNTKKSNFSLSHNSKSSNLQKFQQQSQSDSNSISSSSKSQKSSDIKNEQFQEQQLKKHVSHKHIDIFPNIQIDQVVSQKIMTSKYFQFGQNKKATSNKRRCSLANEDLLSPRSRKFLEDHSNSKNTKNKFLTTKHVRLDDNIKQDIQQTKQRIRKQVTKNKTYVKSSLKSNKVIEDDIVQDQNLIHENEEENQKNSLQMSTSIGNVKFMNYKDKKQSRNSSITKHSIFNQSKQSSSQNLNGAKNKKKTSFCSQTPFNLQKRSSNPSQSNFSLNNNSLPIQLTSSNLPKNNQIIQQSQSGTQQQNQQKSSTSSNEQNQDSIHVIQNKLNLCIQLLQKNELSQLQDYLYDFKDKYLFISNARIQIKWRLMMAHCKENKREYQRAAINYNNVINLAIENPKSLVIDSADVYHRLGVCYSQISEWNKGILAFTQALNRYKKSKNCTKYAQCINNLGTLYLQAESINLAQKCFIQSYDIKKSLYQKNSTKLLTTLFNIFECNILMKNYDQASNILSIIQRQIISLIPASQSNQLLYLGGLFRRKGKLQFMKGNMKQAEQNFMYAFQKLANKYPYCMQFGQLMSMLGLLKSEEKKYKQSKQYIDKAIMLMNFYSSKDSKTILTLKKNLQYAVKMIKQEKQGSSSRRDQG